MRPLNQRDRAIGWKHGFENNYRISSRSCLKKIMKRADFTNLPSGVVPRK